MKRAYAFAIGLVMFVAPMATVAVTASADPYTRSNDYQQMADTVIARGLSQRGVPFSWAGGGVTGPTRGTGSGINTVGFDASGLMQYAYAGAGLKLPRSSGQMYRVGERVLPQQARKADLIFYGPEGTQSVAMYLGNGQMLEVGDVVQVSPVRASGMSPYLVRILGTNSLQTGPVQPAPQAPAQTVPGQQAPAQTLPGQQAPAQTVPGQAPAQTIPGQQAPAQAVPGQAPAQTIPGQQAPAQAVPGQQAPAQTVPGQQAPAQTVPGQQAPVQQAPLQQQALQPPLQQVIPQPAAPLVPTPQPPLQLMPAQPTPAVTAPR
ncbi:NlpC/P60 family peptidoglycan-binding protein RipD [Mycobacterium paragordonae]|uniref:NlpC/P60 family peptidoglycan-binding protein RipD n=1 Tax=Mycobacterium paragordonae TaxID=1389713 RepID=A0A4R5WQY7_9MYCO|nr:NlpC/P60 family peptidoglycan-binding protein RipD [Mycobacterium paragordonae]MDP7735297.1 NlpC/P60 family peptidoglycan-binding protein RipD [Mycobacterium paragordonae]TDK93414.1 NlpC/P60 family peptidoglycan-binding protein RipD [Mycobacterium paragordonae]TDL04859.1 NlpC/P60 family peptidoglycan-binding protein RipD [Mycobacterium paragordonae]